MSNSLKDIAKKYNISIATFSRVINGKDNVKPSTRQWVLEILQKENYVQNNIARSLKTSSTETIGIIIPDIRQDFFCRIIRGIDKKMSAAGYSILLSATNEDETKEDRYLDLMLRQQVDALVIALVNPHNPKLLAFYDRGIPVVFIDNLPQFEFAYDAVLVDNYRVGQMLAQYLLEIGHTQVAVITGSVTVTPSQHRLDGFVDSYRQAGYSIPENLIKRALYEEEDSLAAARDLMETRKTQPFTAVAAMHEMMTTGAIKAIREQGLHIGRDISIAGCDVRDKLQLSVPQITSILQPEDEIGQCAASVLLERLEQKSKREDSSFLREVGRQVLLEPNLLIRDSCKPIP